MFCKIFPFQIMRWKTLSYIVASFFCIFLMRENIKKLKPSFRARRSPKFLAKNRFSVTSVRYYICRTLWCKIWQFFRLTELPFKENFVNITEPGWKIILLKNHLWQFPNSLEECVDLFAFPPNKICIKPIDTDVHVSGQIKRYYIVHQQTELTNALLKPGWLGDWHCDYCYGCAQQIQRCSSLGWAILIIRDTLVQNLLVLHRTWSPESWFNTLDYCFGRVHTY